jgi:hypothetical protein
MRNTADVTGSKPIAVFLHSISGVSAINPLVAFYDIHGGKEEVLFYCYVLTDETFHVSVYKKHYLSFSSVYIYLLSRIHKALLVLTSY